MDRSETIEILLGLFSASLVLILVSVVCCCRKRVRKGKEDLEISKSFELSDGLEMEDLVRFEGGEDLTVHDILEAPGEVVGKSCCGTLYMACLQRNDSVVMLRFLRPACAEKAAEIAPVIQMLGLVRHPNLVPLQALYSGRRGERLFVHPYFRGGNLSQLIRDGGHESRRWPIVYKISLGIAEGLDHLHTGLQKPLVHGNLKSKNVLIDSNHQPYLSDFGLHLLLNPAAGQQYLEASANEGYKAPELIKMKDASRESDVYSLGVIFLELLTGRKPIYRSSLSSADLYLPSSLRNAALNHEIVELFGFDIRSQESFQKYFQLAMACCSSSQHLRPNSKHIVRTLKESG